MFGTALIVPLHINTGDGAVVSEHSCTKGFISRLPRARDGRFETPSLSCIYILTAVSLWSVSAEHFLIMARFRITTKRVKNSNGIRIEPGMSVEVVTQSMSNPVTTNGGQVVVDAFYRIYGIDIKRAGALSMTELNVEQL